MPLESDCAVKISPVRSRGRRQGHASSEALRVGANAGAIGSECCNGSPLRRISRPALVYCDFEDVRRYKDAVALAHDAGQPIGLATLRMLKPGEEGLLARIAQAGADAVLIRNLAGLAYLQERAPQTQLVGDFSLNVANELTAELFFREKLARLVPSYDLNWDQLLAMLRQSDPARFEVVVHQHMPMFHMEHCVFAALLSNGKDWRDCGRPCDRHEVGLRDRTGADIPADCRHRLPQHRVQRHATIGRGIHPADAERRPAAFSLGVLARIGRGSRRAWPSAMLGCWREWKPAATPGGNCRCSTNSA